MILKNAKIFSEGLIHKGAILINNDIIVEVKYTPNENDYKRLFEKNEDNKVL
jgi:hypothetical protein